MLLNQLFIGSIRNKMKIITDPLKVDRHGVEFEVNACFEDKKASSQTLRLISKSINLSFFELAINKCIPKIWPI